ncbi:helix-turn-helix transcriptional regulator [Geodermatophilus sp. DSM 45219]|uniref:helix-turn-helix transcriptional regulator n=1 Tax=Geodermatophilus sp. DSM 45219 TaxID=1881103 RepID=UPI000B81361D
MGPAPRCPEIRGEEGRCPWDEPPGTPRGTGPWSGTDAREGGGSPPGRPAHGPSRPAVRLAERAAPAGPGGAPYAPEWSARPTYFAAQPETAPAWFRALTDPAVGAALRALYADPASPWTVAALADQAHPSRASFARRFTAQLGTGPLSYLTDWRMALARERLRDTDDGLAMIAHTLGYASEFSSQTFKRHHDIAPGRWCATARGIA